MSCLFLKRSLLVLLILLSFVFVAYAQTYQAFVKAGDKSYAVKDYYQSVFYYKSALELDSSHIDIAFNFANACRKINDYKEALHWYAYVHDNSTDSAFATAPFWLGLMKKTEGKYKEAGTLFHKYLKAHGKEENYYTKKAHQEVKACAQAEKLSLKPGPFAVENAGPSINSTGADFNGHQVNDSLLYFSSVRGHTIFPKMYASKKENEKWLPAYQNALIPLDTATNVSNGCLSPDGKAFFCTSCPTDGVQACGLYRSILEDGKWSPLTRLNDTINVPGTNTTQPSLKREDSKGKTVLYFASDRAGGYGKMDLWYSLILANGTLAAPVNLGPEINTMEDDIAPFADPHSNTLYFSSEWHPGLGGFDIFKTHGNLDQWSTPENMGVSVNSGYNDLFFTLYKAHGSLTSNRPGGSSDPNSTCCNDIYLFNTEHKIQKAHDEKKDTLPEDVTALPKKNTRFASSSDLKKTVIDQIKNLPPVNVYFNNDFPEPKSHKTTCPESYAFYYNGYIAVEPLYQRAFGQEAELFFSQRVKKGFEDLEVLTRLVQEALAAGLSVSLKLEGYCSPLTSTLYNHHLAKRRIVSLKNYFEIYSNGALRKYITPKDGEKPQLIFMETFHGESKAPPSVSDKIQDTRNSIYNPAAAAERKVEIQISAIE